MHQNRARSKARAALWLLLVLVVSAASVVIAQRVLTGFEATTDGMPVARGEVFDDAVEIQALPDWDGDAAITLDFDDGSEDLAFGRRVDGEFIIATVDHGSESIGDFLARLDLVYDEIEIASPCEIMPTDNPWFTRACPAYAPERRPSDHPEVDGLACSMCHDPGELEAAYERATRVVLFLDDDATATADRPMPDGHVDVEGMTCSTCHTVAGGGAASGPVDGSATRPADHPDVAPGSCSSCHGGSGDAPAAGDLPSDDAPRPPGHPEVAPGSCSTCHGSSGSPGEPAPTPPGDHPDIGGQSCSSCHDSPTGPSEDDDDEEDDEDDEDDDEHEDDEDHDEHEDDDDD